MRLILDTDAQTLTAEHAAGTEQWPLYSAEAFECLSREWVNLGWCLKYTYSFSWMGRPIIQLPEDMIRMQELIYQVKPDVIVETGVAHGGSLIYYASLMEAMGHGRVIGVDIEIRPHNRKAIDEHPMSRRISLVQGSSIAPETVTRVRGLINKGERVLVLLDSNHTKSHVLAELEAYADFVEPGSYLVAMDGVMATVADRPRGQADWRHDNPSEAAIEFAKKDSRFVLEEPPFVFNEGSIHQRVTHCPSAFLRRREAGETKQSTAA